VKVRRPDFQGRLEGVKVHLREKPIAADVDYKAVASLTGGMSGAQVRARVCSIFCFMYW
jgi:cell division protease FtsH